MYSTSTIHVVPNGLEKWKDKAFKYESLQGGVHAMMGNTWDPWNVLGISWQIYNDFKSVGKTDEEIAKYVEENKDGSELKQIRARVERYKEMMQNMLKIQITVRDDEGREKPIRKTFTIKTVSDAEKLVNFCQKYPEWQYEMILTEKK